MWEIKLRYEEEIRKLFCMEGYSVSRRYVDPEKGRKTGVYVWVSRRLVNVCWKVFQAW